MGSSRVAKASIEFTGDTAELFASFGKIEGRVDSLARSIATSGKNIGGLSTNVEKFLQNVSTAFDRAETGADGFAKAVQRFSGVDSIGTANAYANAVAAVGGVSALTAKEQAEVNRVVNDAIDKYRALGKDAPAALTALAEQTKAVGAATDAADGKSKGFSNTVNSVLAGAVAGVTAKAVEFGVQMVQAAVRGFGEFIERGSRVAAMRDGFTALAGGVDQADERIRYIKSSTQGLIAEFDIMQASNKSMLLGLNLNAQQMGELARTATILGRAMGQDATKSLDDLVIALGRSSPLILDNLGLSVKVEQANEDYARALGKTASELDGAERKQAFMNAAMEAAKEKVAAIGGLHLTAADRVSQLKASFINLTDAASTWIVQLPLINRGLDSLSTGMTLWETLLREGPTAALKRYKDLTGETHPEVQRLGTAMKQLPAILKPLEMSTYDLELAERKLNEQLEEQKRSAEEVKKAHDQLFGRDLISNAVALSSTLGGINNVSKLSIDKKRELHDAVVKAIDAYARLGETAPAHLKAIALATQDTIEVTRNLGTDGFAPLAPSVSAVNAELDHLWSESLTETAERTSEADKEFNTWLDTMGARLPGTVQRASVEIEKLSDKLKNDLLSTLQKFPETLATAFASGGDIEGALKSFSGQVGRDGGKYLASVMGFTGPWGQAIGGAIGSLAPLLWNPMKKLFGIGLNDEIKKANVEIDKVRNSLLDTYGPLDQLEKKANAVGLSFQANWGHQGQAGLKAMKDLVAEFTKRWDALNTSLEQAKTELGGVLDRAKELGYEFDEAGKLVGVNFQKMEEAAKRYGVDLASLGPAFQSARLHASALEIINDFELLTRGGADVGGVLFGMKDQISVLVQDSVKFGTSIPANMQPWIEELMRAGLLTDENGDKITDLTGMKFGEPVATEFQKITAKLSELIDQIAVLVDRISGIATAVTSIPDRTITISTNYVDAGPPEGWGSGDGIGAIPMAEGGMGRVTKPTLFLAGEAGTEDYAFSGAGKKFGDAGETGGLSQLRADFRELRREMARDRRLQPSLNATALRSALALAGVI